MQIKETVPMG